MSRDDGFEAWARWKRSVPTFISKRGHVGKETWARFSRSVGTLFSIGETPQYLRLVGGGFGAFSLFIAGKHNGEGQTQ